MTNRSGCSHLYQVVYRDDGYVYMEPTKARGFYQYLQTLLEIVTDNADSLN